MIASFLQGKGKAGFSETGRFLANSTIGLAGLFDPATRMGLPKHDEDFGQTFATWGIPDGPYVVLPFFGPHTLRGVFALPFDLVSDPTFWYRKKRARTIIFAVRLVDARERLFAGESLLKGSQDRYLSIREAYLQNRQFLIYDGDPPVDEDFYEEFSDEDDESQ